MRKTFYKDLVVWQKSIELVSDIYKITKNFPKEEIFGITSQMRRAAISISSNIAEGSGRGTGKDFVHFLIISIGSALELETQIEIAFRLQLINELNYNRITSLLTEIIKMLRGLIRSLATRN
ncbi:MAG TPA: four helix bundle protein [Candidatus Paceibacterota bacterium]